MKKQILVFNCFVVVVVFAMIGSMANAEEFDPCSLLEDPEMRAQISGALELKLSLKCGIVTEEELSSWFGEDVGEDEGVPPAVTEAFGTDVRINSPADSGTGSTQSETTIVAVGNTVCAAWNDSSAFIAGSGFSGFGNSTNGGLTWTDRGFFPVGPGGDRNFGDPSLAYSDRDNAFYYAALSDSGLSLWKSTNNCRNFTYVDPIHFGGGDDKELMAIDNTPSSPYYGRIYVGWTDFNRFSNRNVVSFSNNGGATWSAPVALPGSGTAGQGMWPAVAPNGDVYFALLNRSGFIGGLQNQWIYRSTNGGASWVQRPNIGSNQKRPENAAASFSCNRQALNGDIRNLSSPQIAIHKDAAAPAGYVIHAIYPYDSDGAGADNSNVFYRRSTNGASSWSAQVQLNTDGTTTDQWYPAIAVNENGVVVASWYDRRLDTANNMRFDRYARVSTDGGLSWGPNKRISDVSSPVATVNPNFDTIIATCYHGDYDQVAVGTTTAHILWSDDRRNTFSGPNPDIYYDSLAIGSVSERDEIIGTWSSGIWYWNVATSSWTRMWSGMPSGDIAAGDFTGDDRADVASNWSDGLWYQNGATLGWTKVTSTASSRLTAGDVTGDGRAEIIGTWGSGIWYWNVATSSWTRMWSGMPSGDIAAGDFTGDNRADVASNWSNGLWYQNGSTLGWTKVTSTASNRVTAGDVTGDSRAEIIGTWGSGIWYWNVATSSWTRMWSGMPSGDIAAGDFTGDNRADVASNWSNGLWYQNGVTLGWTKVTSTASNRLTAGDVTGN